MTKIALLTPPSQFLLDERVFCSLGILKIAAVLENAGHQVDHLDLSGVENYEDVVRAYSGATVFGLTATTAQMPAAIRIATLLRQKPGSRIILGGPHGTLTHAAAKRNNQRAQQALDLLLKYFDAIVCGDGESAIFTAIHTNGVIDADDPKSDLWLTSKGFDESPWPARHLVDIGSYHYNVDERRALSLIGQLGCLAPDTPILLASGESVPISEVRQGDPVLCFNEATGTLDRQPVAQIWQREADDIWEVTWDDGTTLRITGEHPLYTDRLGWQTVDALQVGWVSARLHPMRSGVPGSVSYPAGEVLRETVPLGLAENAPQQEMAECWPSGLEFPRQGYDPRGENSLLHGDTQQFWGTDAGNQKEAVGYQKGGREPHEAPRGSSEGVSNDPCELVGVFSRAGNEELAERGPEAILRTQKYSPEQTGSASRKYNHGHNSVISVDRQRDVLDWPLRFRDATQSGLCGSRPEEGNPAARRLLAQHPISPDGKFGLREPRLEAASGVVRGASEAGAGQADCQAPLLWSKVISKRFLGRGTVHNITVHPVHNYFAAGVLVHNCPFKCSFCGGRNSPSLRNIRLRSSDNVVAEMMHLHHTYGIDGLMMLDDELNVNKQVIPLMRQIAATGVDWRLRGFVKANLFNEEQAEAMYAAGFRWLLCGFESAHPRTLRNIQKMASVEQNTEVIRIAHKYGLKVKALMSFGHPGDSEETLLATRDWLIRERPDDFDCTIITVYPGTPYYDDAKVIEEPFYRYEIFGDTLYSESIDFTAESQYYKGAPGAYRSYVWTDFLTRERMVQLRDEVEDQVRKSLGLAYPSSVAALRFESSMGQSGIPSSILRSSMGAINSPPGIEIEVF